MNRRDQALASLAEKEIDLIVLGGGLLGASITLEAAAAGLSVLLIDKDDFAAGSSSRSSKIAGALAANRSFFSQSKNGPKALAQLQQMAPHMVKDFTFLMPLSPSRQLFGLQAQTQLFWSDLRAGRLAKANAHKRLSKKETLRATLALAPDMVSAGLRFHDYFVDDSRLVIELIKAATARGALAINYLEAHAMTCEADRVSSVTLRDRIEGSEFVVRPKAVISAMGVWTDPASGLPASQIKETTASDYLADEPPLQIVRSTHIILPPSAFETNGGALLLPVAAGRFVFVVPWQRALLVGCTASVHASGPENPLPSAGEIDYLLNAINQYARYDRRVTNADIACAWAGLSIAPADKKSGASVFRGANAVIIAYGGDLSNFKKVAEDAVRLANYQLGQGKKNIADRADVMLSGFTDRQDFLLTTAQIAARARKLGLEPASLDHITTNYGKEALTILDLIEAMPALNERICPDFPPINGGSRLRRRDGNGSLPGRCALSQN